MRRSLTRHTRANGGLTLYPESSALTFENFADYRSNMRQDGVLHEGIEDGLNLTYKVQPNMATDWSVSGDGTDEALGVNIKNLMNGLKSRSREKSLLIKGSGNNQGVLDLTTDGWENNGYGDALYIDIIGAICSEMKEEYPELYACPTIIQYLSYHVFHAFKSRYDIPGNTNSFGSVNYKYEGTTLSKEEVSRCIKTGWDNLLNKNGPQGISSHGEFDGAESAEFLQSVRGEIYEHGIDTLKKISNKNKNPLFQKLMQNGHLHLKSLFIYGCYPFSFTQGSFEEITTTIGDKRFDLIFSKRSSSHQSDEDFYSGLSDTGTLLDPGGIYITDGIRQSYSRVLRMDPEKLEENLPSKDFDIYMCIDKTSSHHTIKSLIVIRKGGNTSEILATLRKNGCKGMDIRKWNAEDGEYQYLKESPQKNAQISIHRVHKIIRDLLGIGPTEWPMEIHLDEQSISKIQHETIDSFEYIVRGILDKNKNGRLGIKGAYKNITRVARQVHTELARVLKKPRTEGNITSIKQEGWEYFTDLSLSLRLIIRSLVMKNSQK